MMLHWRYLSFASYVAPKVVGNTYNEICDPLPLWSIRFAQNYKKKLMISTKSFFTKGDLAD